MFATLAGPLPSPPVPSSADALGAVIALQVGAGLEPLTDAGAIVGSSALEAWRRVADVADGRQVKAIVAGPYSSHEGRGPIRDRERAILATAEATNVELRGLAAASCPMIQVDEAAIDRVGDSPTERRLFARAHGRLIDGVGTHRSLALLAPAEAAGSELLFGLPYESYLFDLIGGPTDWRLITKAPTGRGIVCGVVPGAGAAEVVKEALVWAAQYAASTNGRGLERVGLATTGDLSDLPWDTAVRRVGLLGEAARIAADDSFEHLLEELDPRAMGMKSGSVGRTVPLPERRRDRRSTTR